MPTVTIDPRDELEDSERLQAQTSAKVNELRRSLDDATLSGAEKEHIGQLECELVEAKALDEAAQIALAYSRQKAEVAFAAEEAASTRLNEACLKADELLLEVERFIRDDLPPAIAAVRMTSRPDANSQSLADLTRAARHILQLLGNKKTFADLAPDPATAASRRGKTS